MTILSSADAYPRLAAHYDAALNPVLALEARLLASILPDIEGLLVADVAAGTGRWSKYCRQRGARVVSVDLCHEMLRQAPGDRVQADVRRTPLRDACVDLTICSLGIGYAPECLTELARVTRPGGTLLVSDLHPEAMRRGWRRSFEVGGELIEVASHAYALSDLQALRLQPVRLLEAGFGEPERQIFERTGKSSRFEELRALPAVFVAQWIKT